jgi:succinate dehydrogenase / fumarate reductase iron-sulfur subunit
VKVELEVARYNSKRGGWREVFTVDLEVGSTVLDALTKIKEEQDGSLSFRYSCRGAICGSCGMLINGKEGLACKTQVSHEMKKWGRISLEPLTNLPVVKDLIVEMEPFWDRFRVIQPWLVPGEEVGKGVSDEDMAAFKRSEDCIACACCYSGCDVFKTEKSNYLGPAAYAKAYRFIVDPRDALGRGRVGMLSPRGLWWCTRSYICYEVCPKSIRLTDIIMDLRRISIEEDVSHDGTRHANAFARSILKSGKLNPTVLFLRTRGLGALRDLPFALNLFFRGKTVSPVRAAIPRIAEIKKLFKVAKEGKERMEA